MEIIVLDAADRELTRFDRALPLTAGEEFAVQGPINTFAHPYCPRPIESYRVTESGEVRAGCQRVRVVRR